MRRVLLLCVLAVGCTDPPAPSDSTPQEHAETITHTPAAAAGDVERFNERVVVFMEASPPEIDAARTGMSDDDFGVMADDLMFYRASAHEFLEQRNLPVRRMTGRRPLEFMVDGAVRRYDFAQYEHLDVIVLYEPGREPRVVAPNEVDAALEYYGLTR